MTDTNTEVTTPTFRGSYVNVFKPMFNKLSNKQEYSVEALFPIDADLTVLKNAATAAMIKAFGEDKSKWPKLTRNPFRDQSEKMKEGKLPDGCTEGAVFMRFKSEKKPGVYDQNVQECIDDSKIYSGCYLKASVNAFAYNKAGNCGVSFSLNHVQLQKEGEPFSGRPSAETAFSAVSGAGDSKTDASSLF